MFELAALALLLPLALLWDWFKFIGRLPPREQALAMASHGAGMIALPLIAAFGFFGTDAVNDFLRRMQANPHDPHLWPVALAWAVATLWGARWLLIGAGRARGPWDGLLGSRALFKLALGIGGIVMLRTKDVVLWFIEPDWLTLAWVALMAVATWCAVTGAVKFLLLIRPSRPAHGMVTAHIAASEFQWPGPPRRRWWRSRKR